MIIKIRLISSIYCIVQCLVCAPSLANNEIIIEKSATTRSYFDPNPFDGPLTTAPAGFEDAGVRKISYARDLGDGVTLWVTPAYDEKKLMMISLIIKYADKDSLNLAPENFQVQTLPNNKIYTPSKTHRNTLSLTNNGYYQEQVNLIFPIKAETFTGFKFLLPMSAINIDSRYFKAIKPFRFSKSEKSVRSDINSYSQSYSLANYGISVEDRLKFCDQQIVHSAAGEIVNSTTSLKEPMSLFLSAISMFQHGKKDEAVFWFYASQLRVRYQLVFEKGDRGQLLTIMLMTMGPTINNYAFQDISNLNRILDKVVEWDKQTPNPFRGKPRTPEMDKQIEQIYIGMSDFKIKLTKEKTDLEEKAKKAAPAIEHAFTEGNKRNAAICRKGIFDSTYFANTSSNEEFLIKGFIEDFVISSPEAIVESKLINRVQIESKNINNDSVFPYRYITSLDGGSKKLFAVVNVARQVDSAKFTLACITSIPKEQRNPSTDLCKQ